MTSFLRKMVFILSLLSMLLTVLLLGLYGSPLVFFILPLTAVFASDTGPVDPGMIWFFIAGAYLIEILMLALDVYLIVWLVKTLRKRNH